MVYYKIYTGSILIKKGDFMNDRKQHVIKMAHQLFIDKGFQATSIQDILDYSGISKGTFYNYFPSKNELLIEMVRSIYSQLEKERNELLIGQDPADIDIFIQQIELQLVTNRANKLIALFEEVYILNDEDLKEFIKRGQLRMLRWLYQRFIDLFGEDKKYYLLDCSIIFLGILNQNLKYHTIANEVNASIHQVVQYSVKRLVKMVEEVSSTEDQLFQPELLDKWAPDCRHPSPGFQKDLHHTVLTLKKAINKEEPKYVELLDFIQEELLRSKNPRRFLIESTMASIKSSGLFNALDIEKLDHLISSFFDQIMESA
jgi:AcrR family transcriptional regulator